MIGSVGRTISLMILTELQDRKGFDDWWDDLDQDIKTEIWDLLSEKTDEFLVVNKLV